jgi:hypothetical protein
MRSFLVNKNLCLYYWLKKRIGKKIAFEVANKSEKVILIFGRERIPHRRFRILRKAKQLELIFSIRKDIIMWKLMHYTGLLR